MVGGRLRVTDTQGNTSTNININICHVARMERRGIRGSKSHVAPFVVLIAPDEGRVQGWCCLLT
jgi:hypothetical protein